MLEECINTIKSSYEQFLGSGMYFALFLVSILYIFMKEKDKKKRILFIYFPIVIFAVITNPFFNLLSSVVFTVNTYYRLFWLLPLGIVIAYTAVLVVNEGKDKIEKIVIFVSLFVIIALSGKFYFDTKGTFVEFGNLYKLPDESVLVAQLIGIDEEENKKALVPGELTPYIRQIDSTIELLYGRRPDTAYWDNPLATELDNGNVEYIAKMLDENNCQYVVFKRATVMKEPIQNYGFELINETENYIIYKKVAEIES